MTLPPLFSASPSFSPHLWPSDSSADLALLASFQPLTVPATSTATPTATPTATETPSSTASPDPTPEPTATATQQPQDGPAVQSVSLDPEQFTGLTVGLVLIVMLLAAILISQMRRP